MPRPIKLDDLVSAVRAADPSIEILTNRGKGSHLVLSKTTSDGTIIFPLPTSSGEVLGPYQKKIIGLFGLPEDVFDNNKKRKKSNRKQSGEKKSSPFRSSRAGKRSGKKKGPRGRPG